MSFRPLLLLISLPCVYAIYDLVFLEWRTDSQSEKERQIVEILRTSEAENGRDKKLTASSAGKTPQNGSSDVSLNTAMDRVLHEMEGGGSLDLGVAVDRQTVEREIDSLPLKDFEVAIVDALGKSSAATTLRRLVISKRYVDQVPMAAKFEDAWMQELSADPELAARTMAEAMSQLPKHEYREEHLAFWDIANRLPDGHRRLQQYFPDEEFK